MDGEGVAKNERKGGGGGGAVGFSSGGGGTNGRSRWKGGGGGGYRQHPIIQAYPALLPLPIHAPHAHVNGAVTLPLPPPVLLYLHQPPPPLPLLPLLPKAAAWCYGKPNGGPPHSRGAMWRSKKPPPPPHAVTAALLPLPRDAEVLQHKKFFIHEKQKSDIQANHVNTLQNLSTTTGGPTIAPRPDMGGVKGTIIPLCANHFLVQFDPSQKIFHYDVDISPRPSKETARMIKNKLVEENSSVLSGALPAFDGRKNLYSPIEFQRDRLEFVVSLPVASARFREAKEKSHSLNKQKLKLFRVNIRLVSKLSGEDLNNYLNEEKDGIPLPQDYLHVLDIILREGAMESSIPVGRSFYARSIGEVREIGGGAVVLRGFFQSLKATKQGLALNVDLSLTAFHESTCIIAYLQKRCDFLKDLSQNKTRALSEDERRDVEKALKNVWVFVCHRETDQRYLVQSLTEQTTENLKFRDRSGKDYMVVDYFKEHYKHDIQFRNLPCLQVGRSKPCYVPMELCVVCEGQKFLGKLSDERTSKILKMGCQRPSERKGIIKGVVEGAFSAGSNSYADQFNLQVSKDMTQLSGRVLLPPKLKLGNGGRIKDVTPDRFDRQWNLMDSHVAEGSKIMSWSLISFGGTPEQHSLIPKFVNQLSSRCEQLGILLNRKTVVSPLFERIQLLNNEGILESKLKKIQEAASSNLQLLICVMERKHRGYADLKRIAETSIGVVTQCCLYANLSKLTFQFLANLALKINAKLGGSNVALYNSLSCQIPRIFSDEEPVMFMGADVTHPHPLDDWSPSVAAVVASMNWPSANKYISRMRSQTHRKEIIEHLDVMAGELIEEFLKEVGKLPSRIIVFRDGVSETQFYKVMKEELRAVHLACSRYPGYKPSVTFVVVQKRHHTRLFRREKNGCSTHYSDQNVPPGTVVDTVITHPREFDFYLCSHWGTKGTSRPTHYHVLWDENNFQSDEMQQMVYNLCYTFARCTGPVSLVPPVYYAHLAAYRGRLYLDRSDATATRQTTLYRATPMQTAPAAPLPKLRDSVKSLMFYC
ncbi:protein argonaute 7-like [Phragmites australis]|uniref:protein argonaute 7-like n=1 Tax=Phragmites australis TaxID=29695 RepID=UPI002D77EC49|nr:protein argonaute 7-like [Phragmites australis]